jgi:hypothetical protein
MMQEHISPRKNSYLEFKVFFKVLKFLSHFSHKIAFFFKEYFEIEWGGGEVVMEHAGPMGLYKQIYLEVVKISLAYWSPILQILVDPGQRDGPRLMPIPRKLRIGVPVQWCVPNLKSEIKKSRKFE